MAQLVETRFSFGDALADLGAIRQDVVVLDADLFRSTRSVVFKDKFPERFIDIGISESDMVSTAAGLASSGLIPYVNSFAIFITGVAYMPIRTQICYPKLPVKLIGSSGGLTQGPDGASHQSLEDISLMRSLPNMTVLSPADDLETIQMTAAMADIPGPVYMRVGRYPVPRLMAPDYQVKIGKAISLREGKDVTIFATGIMVWKALQAAELLAADQIDAGVVNVSTIKPLDEATIKASSLGKKLIVSVEEHNIIGGLGSAIAETLSGEKGFPALLRLGVKDQFGESATADELLEKHGLQAAGIQKSILNALK